MSRVVAVYLGVLHLVTATVAIVRAFWPAALACLLLAGCFTPDSLADPQASNAAEHWGYVRGPNGERCLVYTGGTGNDRHIAMDCDTVNAPQDTP